MNTIKDGGPAFPQKEPLNYDWPGMSTRDYFAAKAMQPLLSQANCIEGRLPGEKLKDTIARQSYDMADAMLKAREVTA